MLTIISAVAAAMSAPAALSPAFEDLDRLDRQVAAIAAERGANAQPIDRRLKLQHCPEPLLIEPSMGQSLAVRCSSIGWKLRVGLSGGVEFQSPGSIAASAPVVVRRGDPVTLSVPGPGFAVESSGIAMEDGRLGAVIRIRADGQNRQISGTVTGAGEISLGGLNNFQTRPLSGSMKNSFEDNVR